jgi:MarR family transcriptional regulator, lower aerobic nicotinate degradation pathway regulator
MSDRPYRLDDQVGHLLRRAYQRASSYLAGRIRALDLTPVQHATLIRLWEFGPLSQNQLGRLVAMPPANIHALVRRLEARGLVRRDPSPKDKRLLTVSLTDEGRKMADMLIPLDTAANSDALKPLDAQERDALYAILKKLV